MGGEIFVFKILLIRIIDLVEVMVLGVFIKIVGIWFGEKFYEMMCFGDMVFYIFEYDDYFVIVLFIKFFYRSNNFILNGLEEVGKLVLDGFEYVFDINLYFFMVEEIVFCNKDVDKWFYMDVSWLMKMILILLLIY